LSSGSLIILSGLSRLIIRRVMTYILCSKIIK